MDLTFTSIREAEPGAKWQAGFARAWPGWRAWYLARGGGPRLDEAEMALRRHMPELERPWRRLVELVGGDELAATFLTFWRPPAYLIHCSQAVLSSPAGPVLVRNYDLDPRLSEATVLCSAWCGRQVIATMEAIGGAADGVNAAGLAVSLAFGGRRVVGPGFGVPLIIRYLLEICERTADAVAVLRRVPSHMAYNVTVVDRSGEVATVHLAPDRPAIVTRRPLATNHQIGIEWDEQARFSCTLERERHLEALLARPGLSPAQLIAAFLAPPLFRTEHHRGFGTVYTAAYRPAAAELSLHWPGQPPWRQACADFVEGRRHVRYGVADAGVAQDGAPELGELLRSALKPGRHHLPEPFVAILAEALREPHRADWSRLGRAWAAGRRCGPAVAG